MDTKLIVTVLVLICVNTVINTKQDYVLPVPGCVVVELDTHTECFTHSNGKYANPVDAEIICASKGGRLAIIQHEKTWKSLIGTLLKNKIDLSMWLGFTVLPNTVQLLPNVDLTNMSAYWSPSRIVSSPLQQWIFSYHGFSWDWRLYPSVAVDYLCQYNVTKLKCRITDIEDPRIIVNSCLTETLYPHNSTVEVKCSPGYYLNSSRIIACRNGVWDKPLCIPGCTPPKPKDHAVLISDKTHFNVGDTAFYICKENFLNWRDFDKRHFMRTCQNDSSWSEKDARCSLKRDYTTITINASEISSETLTLECELLSTQIMWIRNGKEIFNSSKFTLLSPGNLLVNSSAENIYGFYMCQTKLGEEFQVGKKAYRIFGRKECSSQLKSFRDREGLFIEGESIILNCCPQDSDDRQVKWFKNENEITSNEHQNIIVRGGLVLKELTQRDKGTYRCQTTYSFKSNSCKFNISYHLNIMVSAETVCGTKSGYLSSYHQPWFVILQHEDEVSPFCFGALLNHKWVVTSAFCLSSLHRKNALSGVYAQLGSPEMRQKFSISTIKIHPNHRNRRYINDIGLIQLAGNPVKFDDDIVPICISSEDIGNIHKCENSANLKGTLTGWSAIMTEKIYDVASIEKNLASKNVCRSSGQCGFAEDKFCSKHGDDKLLVETATGDNGSPFVVTHNKKEYLLGIFTGGENNQYDCFTSIFHHYDWIERNINQKE